MDNIFSVLFCHGNAIIFICGWYNASIKSIFDRENMRACRTQFSLLTVIMKLFLVVVDDLLSWIDTDTQLVRASSRVDNNRMLFTHSLFLHSIKNWLKMSISFEGEKMRWYLFNKDLNNSAHARFNFVEKCNHCFSLVAKFLCLRNWEGNHRHESLNLSD